MMFRLNITHKLFAAFLLILGIVVGAMFLARYIFFLNFQTYIHQVELEKLQALVPTLRKEYTDKKGWQGVLATPDHWYQVLNVGPEILKVIPPPHEEGDNMGKGPRILLSDAELKPILGEPGPNDEVQLVAIDVAGKTVGWLGLEKKEPFRSGPPAALIKRQTRHLSLLGLIVVGLTGLVAYLVSRHMVRPIRELTRGTRELANRNFQVSVHTGTQDELGQLAHHFNSMARRLDRYESMRQQWLSDISHELRTPLAVLRGEIEALQDGIRKPTVENLGSLHDEIVRISTLVEDLHQLSLADSYGFFLEKQQVDVHALIRQKVDSLRTVMEKRSISVQYAFQEESLSLYADPVRLQQVFHNILDNGCKYMEEAGQLSISSCTDKGNLHLCFEDSGPGVSEQELEKIFDRLYRCDLSRSRVSGGSGLGLSICRQIIEAHKGSIWAEKGAHGGLAVHLSLPVHDQV